MQAQVRRAAKRIAAAKHHTACVGLGPHIETEQLSDAEVLAGDKAPAQAEGGCRFLQDPLFVVSSWFVKKPCRLQGLWMGLTLALLVYAVAQRRRRRAGARHNEPLPNPINQPTSRPTLRGVLQVLDGIERRRVTVDGQARDLITGWNEVKINSLHLFGEQGSHVSQLPSG